MQILVLTARLVSKNRGTGGMTSRQLRRIVQQAFDLAYEKMGAEGFDDEAKALARGHNSLVAAYWCFAGYSHQTAETYGR